nr:MAG TPA: hypothetical protein [Caudoviricetes sp.]
MSLTSPVSPVLSVTSSTCSSELPVAISSTGVFTEFLSASSDILSTVRADS